MNKTDKRKKILESALKLFITKGFDNTSTGKITKNAGVGTGTLFNYFKSKKELINTLYLETYQRSSEEVAKDLNEEEPIKEQLRKLFLNYAKWAINNYNEYKFLLQFEHSPYFSDISTEQENSDYLICRTFVLNQGNKEKIFKNFPEDLIWDIIDGFHVAIIEYYHKENIRDNKLLNKLFETLWIAISK